MEQQKENPFDKVFLVAKIATLESQYDDLLKNLQLKEQQIEQIGAMLRRLGNQLTKVVNISQDKVLEAAKELSGWLDEKARAQFEEAIKSPMFAMGFSSVLKILILEAVNGDVDGAKPSDAGAQGADSSVSGADVPS